MRLELIGVGDIVRNGEGGVIESFEWKIGLIRFRFFRSCVVFVLRIRL